MVLVDCYPKVVGWERGNGFSGLGILDCWLCSTPRKFEEWLKVVFHFGIVCSQSGVNLQNLGGWVVRRVVWSGVVWVGVLGFGLDVVHN